MATPVWALTGNPSPGYTGTVANNFLGTTDKQPLVIKTLDVERLRVDASGNVGIGTKSPARKLTIQGSGGTTASLGFNNSSNQVPYVGVAYDQANDGLALMTNVGTVDLNRTPLFIQRVSSNVGIGTTAPQKPLDVAGSGGIRISQTGEAANTNEIYFADNGQIRSLDDNHRIIFNRSANELELREFGTITFSPGATQGQRTAHAVINSGGNVGVGTVAPSTKLHVEGANDQAATVAIRRSDNNKFARLGVGASGVTLEFDSSSFFTISNNGTLGIGGILNGAALLMVTASGNVGIGTTSPAAKLDVQGGSIHAVGAESRLAFGTYSDPEVNVVRDLKLGSNGLAVNGGILVNGGLSVFGGGVSIDGNVGIALDQYDVQRDGEPSSPLVVHGDIRIKGSGNLRVFGGDVLLEGADCAEDFDVAGDQPPDPGTVVVIDEGGALRESEGAYDKKVAGVVSGAGEYRHGLVLDKRSSKEGRIPVALVGKVYCKVDAQYSPIEVGDLLTTSPTPGHAMKAWEPRKAFGSVIGKALRPLTKGQSTIPILIALQ